VCLVDGRDLSVISREIYPSHSLIRFPGSSAPGDELPLPFFLFSFFFLFFFLSALNYPFFFFEPPFVPSEASPRARSR